MKTPRSSPTRNPEQNAPASYPSRSKCSAVVYADRAALERLPDLLATAAAQRRALAVMHEDEHHHEPANPDAPARCAGTSSLSGQPIAAQTAPGENPGLSAPIWKARSQSRMRPRKLRVIRLSLRASCVAAACRLRRSCHRHRGPVVLPRSGCPVRRSCHSAALSKPTRAPPPAAPRGILPSCPAAPPRSTPAKRRAILKQQSSTKTTNQDPHTHRLFDPTLHSGSTSKVCASRTFVLNSPLLGLMVPPGGPPRWFCCGAAARAGERLQNKAGEVSPDPSYSAREACRRRNPPQTSSPCSSVIAHVQTVTLRAAGVQSPAVCSASVGRARGTGLLCAGVVPVILPCNLPGTPWYFFDHSLASASHFSRRAAPCQSALVSLRQAFEAVGSYAQRLSCLAESRSGGNRHPLLPARRKARAYGNSRHRRLSVLNSKPCVLPRPGAGA